MDQTENQKTKRSISRRTFILKGGKLFGLSVLANLTPFTQAYTVKEMVFWARFKVTQAIDSIFYPILHKYYKQIKKYLKIKI